MLSLIFGVITYSFVGDGIPSTLIDQPMHHHEIDNFQAQVGKGSIPCHLLGGPTPRETHRGYYGEVPKGHLVHHTNGQLGVMERYH